MNYIYALKITTDIITPGNSDIGLYYIAGEHSVFRWSEVKLKGTVEQWQSGIINSVDEINKGGDFINAGGVCSADGFNVTIYNNNQLSLQIKEFGISFNGLKCQIYEFVGTDADADSYEIANIYFGVCENLIWGQLTGTFNVKSSLHKRRANIATLIDSSKIVPVTFGQSDPTNGRYFKAVRTTSVVQTLKQEDLAADGVAGTNFLNPKMQLFPVYEMVGTSPSLIWKVRLGYMDSTALPADCSRFVGMYVLIKEGTNAGIYRKITAAERVWAGQAEIQLTFADYFPEDLAGNYTGTATNQSWLEFVDIDREYLIDSLSCKGYFDEEGNALGNAAQLYAKSDTQVVRIAEYGYDYTTLDNKKLVIDPKLFTGNPDTMLSFLILPVTVSPCDEDSLAIWDDDVGTSWEDYDKIATGLFYRLGGGDYSLTSSAWTNGANTYDKSPASYASYAFAISALDPPGFYIDICKAFEITLPEIAETLTFNNVYLGLKYHSYSTNINESFKSPLYLKKRGYINRLLNLKSIETYDRIVSPNKDGTVIDNISDFYWTPSFMPAYATNNRDFYVDKEFLSATYTDYISGYKHFPLNVANVAEYSAIVKLALLTRYYIIAGQSVESTTKIYEMAAVFEMECYIKDVIYV